ncbi:hypothetical protein [Sphingomonas sanguinis]|uniref:hypothetical protein n=1 Tax=Sphingomonas sanguinis TaxID=33051 RepID=UPI003019124B
MTIIDVALPVILIGLKFVFRVFGHKASTWTEIVQAAIMLPVDMLFLSYSFCAAVAMARPDHAETFGFKGTMVGTLSIVIITFFVVFLCRESESRYVREGNNKSILFFSGAFFLSVFSVIVSIALVGSL